MKWHFVRHGQILSNTKKIYSGRSDEKLTPVGEEQVLAIGQKVSDINFDAIITSPLVRTRQTSEIISTQLKNCCPIIPDEHFNEIKMGPWEGMSETDVEASYPVEWGVWNKVPAELEMNGRETLEQIKDRIVKGMKNIESQCSFESVLVVSHVAILRVIILLESKQSLNLYKTISVDNAKFISLKNTEFLY